MDLIDIAERIAAQAGPGEQIEAYVARAGETSVRVYQGDIEQLASAQSAGIGVRVIRNGRTGFAHAGSLEAAGLDEVLASARENAEFGSVDEWAGLAEPDGVPQASLELWNDRLMDTSADAKVALAMELDRLTAGLDARVTVESSDYSDAVVEGAIATSTGVRTSWREAGCYISVSTLAAEGDETQTGFGFSVGRTLDELVAQRAADDGVQRATRLLGSTKPASGRFTVVFDPFVTAQFLGVLSATVNGEAVTKGRSLFAGRLGEQVASPLVTLVDDPTNPLAYSATAVDGEGLATRRNVVIDGGVLRTFVHSSYSARRAGTVSTGSAVRGGYAGTPGCGCMALSLVPGTATQAELVAGIDEGVLIQQVSGIHSGVNPISGDFSTGAAGLRINKGTVGAPIREFTIASTLQKMLGAVVAVGGDIDWLPMRAAGMSLVIEDLTISGN